MNENNICKNAEELRKIAEEVRNRTPKYSNKTTEEIEGIMCKILNEHASMGYDGLSFVFDFFNIFIKPEQVKELDQKFKDRGYNFEVTYKKSNECTILVHQKNNTKSNIAITSLDLDN